MLSVQGLLIKETKISEKAEHTFISSLFAHTCISYIMFAQNTQNTFEQGYVVRKNIAEKHWVFTCFFSGSM